MRLHTEGKKQKLVSNKKLLSEQQYYQLFGLVNKTLGAATGIGKDS